MELAETLARRYPARVGGVPLSLLALRVVQRFIDVRVMGLAAEMTYYATLSVFPLVAALGASLGFLERVIGSEAVDDLEQAVLVSLDLVFSAEVTEGVVAPMIQGLLEQERAGFAIGSLLLSLFLASRVFRSAIHTLDTAYTVEEGRGTVGLWALGFLFSLGAIVTATAVLSMVVVGPLLGGGRVIAHALGLGTPFEIAWSVARWPVVFAIATGFLAVLYRAGPNVQNAWRQSLPGAILGMAALILVAVGFRIYLGVTGIDSPEVRDAEEAVAAGAQVVGAIMAALLWLWLSSVVVLTGGVLNAELSRLRGDMPPKQA
jgi:membrane protein